MKIDVGDLLKQVGNETYVKSEENLSFPEEGLPIEGPVKVDVHLVNIGKSILVNGTIKARIKLNCVRCLKEFDSPITIPIEEEYSKNPKVYSSRGDEIELKSEDFIFKIEEDNTIDMGEAIRQNLLTALPIKPLCRKACKGLPQGAGKKEKTIDPRLAVLKDILKK